ncbi:MAG: FtsX-like permease family protein [Bacteroidales bacterium]|nr:FtsX-like permease family protein [Bacteroidales bacterium]
MKSYLNFLSRNKLYTTIEFVGLSVALAFVIISFCYVVQQYSVTRENPDRERIYAVGSNQMTNGYGMKDLIGDKLPEVEIVTHFYYNKDQILNVGNESSVSNFLYCDREFFDFFPVKFKEGNADDFIEANVAFISEKVASKLEGEIIGQKVVAGKDTLNVVGIISDLGSSLLYDADVIGNIATCKPMKIFKKNPFSYANFIHTFLKVSPNADRTQLNEKITGLCKEEYGEHFDTFFDESVAMFRMDELFFNGTETHLHQGDHSMLRTVVIVGLLLLLSALINYINLNVALVGKRAKEMASRRLLGAQKSDIVWKFLGEAFVFTLCCFAIGLLLAYVLVPTVNDLLQADVAVRIPFAAGYLVAYLLIVVVVALLAGIMPALIVSQVRPIDVVKGAFRFRSRKGLSRFFIVFQNAISIVLIALVLTMELQMRHLVERPIGLQTDNLYFISSRVDNSPQREAFIEDLRALPCVKELAMTTNIPTVSNMTMLMSRKGETVNDAHVNFFVCDTAAFRMMDFQVVEKFHEPDESSGWMTESTMVGMTGLPYGDYNYDTIMVWMQENFKGIDICGVIKDFNMLDALHATDEDYSIVFSEDMFGSKPAHFLLDIIGNHDEAKRAIDAAYEKHAKEAFGTYRKPDHSDFVKNVIARKYNETRRQMRLIEMIMAISVLLSLLGLVAISTHFASEREKTIAIRKVFGGTIQSEIRRNLKEYIIMILIANAIAIPVAVWLCHRYLEDFAYRIDLHPWIFVVTVALSFVIAIGSVLWQIVSVARVNPVTALKKE